DGREAAVARDPEPRRVGLAQDAALDVGLAIGCRDACRAVQPQASQLQLAARAQGQPFDAVVARQTPAWRPGLELPRRRRQPPDRATQLLHFAPRHQRVAGPGWAAERWWQLGARQQSRAVSRNREHEAAARAASASADDILPLLLAARPCGRV